MVELVQIVQKHSKQKQSVQKQCVQVHFVQERFVQEHLVQEQIISEVGTQVFVREFGSCCWGLFVITSSEAMSEAVCRFDTYLGNSPE